MENLKRGRKQIQKQTQGCFYEHPLSTEELTDIVDKLYSGTWYRMETLAAVYLIRDSFGENYSTQMLNSLFGSKIKNDGEYIVPVFIEQSDGHFTLHSNNQNIDESRYRLVYAVKKQNISFVKGRKADELNKKAKNKLTKRSEVKLLRKMYIKLSKYQKDCIQVKVKNKILNGSISSIKKNNYTKTYTYLGQQGRLKKDESGRILLNYANTFMKNNKSSIDFYMSMGNNPVKLTIDNCKAYNQYIDLYNSTKVQKNYGSSTFFSPYVDNKVVALAGYTSE